ncbi:MAG: hypothetical protein P4M08_15375 [Oligoflexia bacterium]|nr:hypothetical protein [Oligoflexia bacterium]
MKASSSISALTIGLSLSFFGATASSWAQAIPSPSPSAAPSYASSPIPSPAPTPVPSPSPSPTPSPTPSPLPKPTPRPLPSPVSSADFNIDRLQNGVLYFQSSGGAPAPAPLQTHLDEAKLLGSLRPLPNGGQPFLLLTGKTCKNCQADPGLFLIPPSGGKPNGYIYPGRIFARNRSLVYESRAFYGRCLTRKNHDVLVIFQREIVDRRHGLLKSVLIAEPALQHEGGSQSHIHDVLLERNLPVLATTLRMLKDHECREIPGRSRIMLNRPLDVQLRNTREHDNDDDDSDDDAGANAGAEPEAN